MKKITFKHQKPFILLLICFSFIKSFADERKNLRLNLENISQKKLEIIIETPDTTIYFVLKKNKIRSFLIPWYVDSSSYDFNFTLKRKLLFREKKCAIRNIHEIINNESKCSKTNQFIIEIYFKKLSRKSKNSGVMAVLSCSQGKYIHYYNIFQRCPQ